MIMKIKNLFNMLGDMLYTWLMSFNFKRFGKRSIIRCQSDLIVGKEFIEIGERVRIGKHVQLTAWGRHQGKRFNPSIKIGSGTQLGAYNHITAINNIEIGNGVLTGKFVTISDNSHGMPGDENDCEFDNDSSKLIDILLF